MLSAIITSIIGYLAGSILWRIATIMAAIAVILWLARRLRKGPKGVPAFDFPEPTRVEPHPKAPKLK